MSKFYGEIADILEGGGRVAVASIAKQKGSSPRSRGTSCAVREDGSIIGTIGGGLIEATAQKAALEALADGKVRLLEMDLDAADISENKMICGGKVELLIVPWGAAEAPVARALARPSASEVTGVLRTRWRGETGKAEVLLLDPDAVELSGILAAAEKGRTLVQREGEGGSVHEIVQNEAAPLLVLGGGHVGKALGFAATWAGFAVTVVDDRAAFASPEAHPSVFRVVHADFGDYLAGLTLPPRAFVVILTRNHQLDALCALACLKGEAGYVGMIGSKRKSKMIIDHVRAEGIGESRLQAFHTPVGLPIGAQTPEEIAVSILAELIRERRLEAK